MFSWRSSIHLTGRPNTMEMWGIAISSGKKLAFSPKPPPTSGATTRMLLSGRFSTSTRRSLMSWGCWVESQTVSRSSAAW